MDQKETTIFLAQKSFSEFLRYVLVGGLAFLIDAGSLFISKEYIFSDAAPHAAIFRGTAIGFAAGLTFNYVLSQIFVFRSKEQRERGLRGSAFLVFALIGLIGFVLTELFMYVGVRITGPEGLAYLLVKCLVAALILIWNYLGRKMFVYKGC